MKTNPMAGLIDSSGAGNAPGRPELTDVLREACDRGVVIVAISQCTRGAVSDAYETGRTLLQVGVIPGGDMTPEVSNSHRMYFKILREAVRTHKTILLTL